MAWKEIKDEFSVDDIGGRLLANLAKGIYSPANVLREYVQNAADAYTSVSPPPQSAKIVIQINPDKKSISVTDYGIGMDEKELRKAQQIALSPKTGGAFTGFRGIGIWAGFEACNTLEIRTKKSGSRRRARLVIDFASILKEASFENKPIMEVLEGRLKMYVEDVATNEEVNESYTEVTLESIREAHKQLLDAAEVGKIISQTLPCRADQNYRHQQFLEDDFYSEVQGYQEYQIMLGTDEVFKSFPTDGMLDPERKILCADDGTEVARAWWCAASERAPTLKGNEYRGFSLRVKNFAVGPHSIYDDQRSDLGLFKMRELGSPAKLERCVGEIHITNDKIVPDTPRNRLEFDALARQAIEAIRAFYAERIAQASALSTFNSNRKTLEEIQAAVASGQADLEKLSEYRDKLKKIGDQVKGGASQEKNFLRGLVNKPAVKKQRSDLQRKVQALLEAAGVTKGQPAKPEPISSKNSKASGTTPTSSTLASASASKTAAPKGYDAEELLSEIIAILTSTISDPDVVQEVSEAIQKLFVDRRLIGELVPT